jgi:hypothetical protein
VALKIKRRRHEHSKKGGSLEDKVAIIPGAGRGLGRSLAPNVFLDNKKGVEV